MRKREHFILWICVSLLFLSGCSALTRANAKLDHKEYDEAIRLYKAYLEKNPDSSQAKKGLGLAYLRNGSPDMTVAEFEPLADAGSCDPDVILYLSLAYLKIGEPEPAITVLQGYENRRSPFLDAEVKRQLGLMEKFYEEGSLSKEENRTLFISQFENAIENAVENQEKADQKIGGLRGGEGGSGSGGSDSGG